MVGNEIELFTVSRINSWRIKVINLNKNCEQIVETVYNPNILKEVLFLKLDEFYVISLD